MIKEAAKSNPVIHGLCRQFKAKIASLTPASIQVKRDYRRILHKKLNLKSPKTYNEKLQWLKVYLITYITQPLLDKK
ncbi:hypothetical protein JI57_02280 [Psychromonas sp. PRT-SC03]|nr:hypothetical protein JI57_02280 [Psychromonas sp. PRT-SC03]